MRVLDLFCGLGGASSAFRERGHEVVGVELNPKLVSQALEAGGWRSVVNANVRDLDPAQLEAAHGPFDFVWASPPCQTFSVLTISTYHDGRGRPDHALTHERLALVHDTLALIRRLEPAWFVVENPRGMLRNQDFMAKWDRATVSYCRYGHFLRKPTDLWGGFPDRWNPRPMCDKGDPCHDRMPRGQGEGFQAFGEAQEEMDKRVREAWERDGNKLPSDPERSAVRSLVPYELSEAFCRAAEESEGSWWGQEAERPEQVRLSDVAGGDG